MRPGRGSAAPTIALSTMVLYNLAGFAFNLYDTVLYTWLNYFYAPPEDGQGTGYVGLGTVAFILAAGRVLDAVTDPLVGYLSDRTRTRWGRRKPWIVLSAPILFLSFVAVWTPPVAGESTLNALYLGAVLFLYYWSYTGSLIPWLANLPELSPVNAQRVKIATLGVAIGVLGALLGGGLSGPLLERFGALAMALLLGGFGLVTGLLTALGVREPVRPASAQGPGFLASMRLVFGDHQVLSFAAMITLVQMTYQLMLMNVPYLTTLVLGEEESMASVLMGEIIILIALSTPLWFLALKTWPKRHVMRAIIGLMVLGFGAAFFIGGPLPGSPLVQAMVIFPLASVPMGGMFAAALGLLSDLTDYGDLKHGSRIEATYFGIYGIMRKAGWALCSVILFGTFSLFGWSAQQPLGVSMVWVVCALCCLLGLVLFIPYRVGDSREQTARLLGLPLDSESA